MTLLLASAGDLYSALSANGLDVFETSLTFALALLLTVNMIIERREFLDMLVEIDTSHLRLSHDFKASLIEIKRFSTLIRDAERIDIDAVRRAAADIHRDAERLDGILEEMLEEEGAEHSIAAVAPHVATPTGEVVATGTI
jgi:signal transduction histidine kinase